MRPGFQIRTVLLLLLALGVTWTARIESADANANRAPSAAGAKPHKIQVSDPFLATEMAARGARLLTDYGGYKLFEVDAVTPEMLNAHVAEIRDEYNLIMLNVGAIDTTTQGAKALRKSAGSFAGKRLHLVQLAGPVRPDWHRELLNTGVQIISYVPQNTYLVYSDVTGLAQLQTLAATSSYIQWDGGYLDEYKIHPKARVVNAKGEPQKADTDMFAIQLVDDPQPNAASLQLIDRHKLAPVINQFKILNYLNVIVRLPAERLPEIAAQPEVVSIHPYLEHKKRDERQDQILAGNLLTNVPSAPGYLAWLASKGFAQSQFTASGFAVDLTDSGIDNATTAPGHFGLYPEGDSSQPSRVIYNRLEGTPNTSSTILGCDGHGNLNSHIIAGYNDQAIGFPHTDAAGFHYGLGVCPFVKVGSSVIFDPDRFTNPNYPNLQSRAHNDGARISSNSWGANTGGDYDVDAQAYDALVRDAQPDGSSFPLDGNQEMVIVFAAGNAGSGAQTVGSPGSAKNVITVGAAENVQSHATANGGNDVLGNDGCSVPDSEANSANDIPIDSSRGPCADGRKKPDIVAPGTHVTGGVGQVSPPPSPTGTGSALSCFVASGVCALPGGGTAGNVNNFFPLGQQFFTTSSGTSHATPAVAGACALVRQNFINQSLTPPSAAMTKAFLMNSARYLNGVGANDSLWSNNQGLGEVNLGFAFDATARILRDQLANDKFTATGQTRTFVGTVTDSAQPFRVTLAWTDAPGTTTGNAFNNNLDLIVTVGGNTYKGNVFSGAFSVPGGSADTRNNVESVFLPAGVSGNFVVTVTATSINSDGVPNEAPSLDQDFALVVYNGAPAIAPVIVGDSLSVVAESCAPANGAVDPDETVTVNLALRNLGTRDTSNLVATLQATGGVTAVSGPQGYGALIAGGPAVTNAFSFTASGVCGGNIGATLQLQEGSTNLGEVTFLIPLGQLTTIFAQNFDGVATPGLPPGWTSSASGAESAWVTSTAVSDTAPNAAFSPDPSSAGVNELVSPAIPLPTGLAQLTFRHNYNTESGYDGGVLEIRIGSGDFTDIGAAGGSFASGDYNEMIRSTGVNPLAGRQAWSGNSGGFVTTVVNLPSTAAGQNVQFRWRCGTDATVGGAGWYVDSIAVTARLCCGGSFTLLPIIVPDVTSVAAESCAPANNAIDPSETVTVNFGLRNVGSGNTTNLVATLLSGGGVMSPTGPANYGALPAGGAAVTRSFTFTDNPAVASCGDTIAATFQLQDGAANLGTVAFTLRVGQVTTGFAQNFDGVTAPSLPASWTTSASGAQSTWITSTTARDTLPNAAFSSEATSVGVNELVSPSVIIPARTTQLSFRNKYDLEADITGYDGGVLEIKIGNGAFVDILAAGGSFVSGGYPETLSSSFGNPLAGRQAWSGQSSGFVNTVVNLPSAAAGQSAQFRWRCGTDSSVGGGGWYVDTITLTTPTCCGDVAFPFVVSDTVTLVAEACTNAAVDPDELVTMSFGLRNGGSANTTNLVAILQGSGGVTAPSGPQAYGALTAGGGTVERPFTFVANGACGGTITATLRLQDGVADLGTVDFVISLGRTAAFFTQNFDSVTTPSLPAGWTTSVSGAQFAWVTATTRRDTLPNSVFARDPTTAGITTLVSPVIALPTGPTQLSFRHYYGLEADFDGGVLEIKIGGGAFADIVTAGGSFAEGGYSGTIDSSFGNPLGDRPAWTGTSGAFITTTVNLPAAAAGQNIQLRWRCGSDSSASNLGWWVDTIALSGPACCIAAPLSRPILLSPRIETNGLFTFIVSGDAGHNYLIEASTNFSNWLPISTLSNAAGQVPFTETNPPTDGSRWYRAKIVP